MGKILLRSLGIILFGFILIGCSTKADTTDKDASQVSKMQSISTLDSDGSIQVVIWLKNPVENLEACGSSDQTVEDACVSQQSQYEDDKTLIKNDLKDLSEVEDFEFINQEKTFAEFGEYYADSPEILELIQPKMMPESFRVTLNSKSKEDAEVFKKEFADNSSINRIEVVTEVQPLRYEDLEKTLETFETSN